MRGADYILRRTAFALITVIVAITLNFVLFRALPGNAITNLSRVPHATDVLTVIKGVLQAEEEAIAQYNALIKLTDGVDYVTQDLAITLLGQEEAHRQQFEGYLKEYMKK